MPQQSLPITRLIRQADLLGDPEADPPIPAIIPVGASTLWRWVAAKKFPAPIKLGQRVTAWRCSDVAAWIEEQAAEKPKAAA
jgi:prophage regulatory protein